MSSRELWSKFKKYYIEHPNYNFALDISRVDFSDKWIQGFKDKFKSAHKAMAELEKGAIANPDEKRMVGHYWLRGVSRAPGKAIQNDIRSANRQIEGFSKKVFSGKIKGRKGPFKNVLLIGIGGSALGPQFLDHALRPAKKGLKAHFLDNTDSDGIDRVLNDLKSELGKTLCIVISKSGGTKETRNGMLEAQSAYRKAKLDFAKHAVAVTGEGSGLYNVAKSEGWLDIFPMWDWVGGRTSVMSAVGLLPMALSGYNIQEFLAGASDMDQWTREANLLKNPGGLLAAMWYFTGKGKGEKDMVILPYKDRLELFSKYLQQLVMESLGKEKNLRGRVVNQGIAVYGNKGSTDQHAYVQQLRDGLHNFFVTFIEVKKSRSGASTKVETGVTSGDYLEGFYLGTRRALHESGRQSITVSIDEVNERNLGRLIALFERAVGYYASFVGINAYHQPGVEAGKKAAQNVIDVKAKIVDHLKKNRKPHNSEEVARGIGASAEVETVFKLLEYLCENRGSGVARVGRRAGVKSRYKGA